MKVEGRACGTCTVCCTYLKINQPPELVKIGLKPCDHILEPGPDGYTGGGCGIYDDRPAVCQNYSCLWLYGYGDETDRPDRCGVLVDTVLPIENAIQCKPIWAGAGDSPTGDAAIRRMSRDAGKPALVARFPETMMVRVVGRGCE